MKSTEIAPLLLKTIKIVSTMLISGAIILVFWDLTANSVAMPLHDYVWKAEIFKWVILIARLALISHFIEAIIAGFAAKSQGKNPLTSAVYTFFVGTFGLLEVLNQLKSPVVN